MLLSMYPGCQGHLAFEIFETFTKSDKTISWWAFDTETNKCVLSKSKMLILRYLRLESSIQKWLFFFLFQGRSNLF